MFHFLGLLLVASGQRRSLPGKSNDPSIALPLPRSYEFHVAPMQGYTNAPLRHLFQLLSPDAILWTEMEKVKDLLGADDLAIQKRFGDLEKQHDNRHRLTLQLGGNDAFAMEKCVSGLLQSGYQFREINLNCGCPSIEAGGADYGASLMKQPALTRTLFEAIGNACRSSNIHNTHMPAISLKCRTAVFDDINDLEFAMTSSPDEKWWKDEHFQSLCEYIDQAQLGGISHVVLHSRPAILSGLSPTKNRLIPPLDYDFVEQVASEFPALRVTLNGGIQTLQDLKTEKMNRRNHIKGESRGVSTIGSHMAGRWLLRSPMSLLAIQHRILDSKDRANNVVPWDDIFAGAIEKYMRYVEGSIDKKIHPWSELCLPLYLAIEELRTGFEEDAEEHLILHAQDDVQWASEHFLYETMKEAVERMVLRLPGSKQGKSKAIPREIHWKRLSSALKNIVGTKVYNKWRRNRKELLPS
ncbi:dihydrouridine(20/20a) synthase [Seminavis robusta]|uniref:Dihydrouridine(20/20a) synthase n=1 Tax=Seminavis robusta TaxID=568900 RepID=A0A9N8H931_9STRA|nr:dihydrouridine(20/20a) synthase [Seminavis robusta]|eukprot:Sro190_g081990.1 dihydrouridine(20/20a) synthase (468) ;mRNA; r:83268-84671